MSLNQQENTSEFSVSLSLDFGNILLDSEMIEQLYFIEDIFSYSITGKLKFKDNKGVFEFGPITGNETITLIYGIEDFKELTFNIYKIKKIEKDTRANDGSSQTIEMFFADKTFYPLNFLKFSKSFTDKRISDIIKDLVENFVGVSSWDKQEKSKELLDFFYLPYWTINQTITWLLKRCTSNSSKNSDMIFYNNVKGANFVSMETLLSQRNLMTLKDDDGKYCFSDDNLFLYNKILDWKINSIDAISLKNLNGATNFGYNTNKKEFIINERTYKKNIKDHTILGNKTLFPDYSDSRSTFNLLMEDTDEKLKTINKNKWTKIYDLQQTSSIVVRGHEERYCGGLIEINWPSKEFTKMIYNKNLSGYYLIKSITHNFTGYSSPAYLQKMVLIKNGYEDSDAANLYSSIKKNIAK
jgi:hypothetical protein